MSITAEKDVQARADSNRYEPIMQPAINAKVNK